MICTPQVAKLGQVREIYSAVSVEVCDITVFARLRVPLQAHIDSFAVRPGLSEFGSRL